MSAIKKHFYQPVYVQPIGLDNDELYWENLRFEGMDDYVNEIQHSGDNTPIRKYFIDKNAEYQTLMIESPIHAERRQKYEEEEVSLQKINFMTSNVGDDENMIEDNQFYPQTFRQGTSFLGQMCFLHITKFMLAAKSKLINKGIKLRIEHLPILDTQERIEYQFQKAQENLQLVLEGTNQIITYQILLRVLFFGVLKWKTFWIVMSNITEACCKCVTSILMSFLIETIYKKDLQLAYGLGTILGAIQFISLIAKHQAYYLGFQFSISSRMILINMIYQHLLNLNAYSIKEANVGKIINVVSGDLNALEGLMVLAFQVFSLPVAFIFSIIILCVRFEGPIGLLAIVIMMISYPLSTTMQRKASVYMLQAKQNCDQRLKLTNEFIEGIRLIKMYAWEDAFKKFITAIRQKEIHCYLRMQFFYTLDRSINMFSHVWSSLVFFVIIYYGDYTTLTSEKMISTLQLMIYIRISCIFMVSYAFLAFINIKQTFARISELLNIRNCEIKQIDFQQLNEYDKNEIQVNSWDQEVPVISMKNFSCFWSGNVTEDSQPVLKNINLDIYQGDLVAVIGKIGSGKSTFLNCIIKEVPSYSGQFLMNNQDINQENELSIVYVEQEPFIFPDSVKRNILFGRPLNQEFYNLIIHISNIEEDLSKMPYGDETEIGEKGVNLSGGQRARISLARALYQMADIYVFDDPLSAVDAKVARNIFNNAIKEFIFKMQPKLSGKKNKPIVLLATHQIQYALECDYMVVLNQGQMVAKGKYEDVKDQLNMVGKDFVKSSDNHSNNEELQQIRKKNIQVISQRAQIKSTQQNVDKETKALYKREENTQSDVTTQTYKRYFFGWNPKYLVFLVIVLNIGQEVINNLYFRYIAVFNDLDGKKEVDNHFTIMGIFCIVIFFNNLFRYTLNYNGVLRNNKRLHANMLNGLCLAPISYFDTNPSGRIINRFSNDLSQADGQVNLMLWDIWELMSFFFISLVTLVILQYWFIFAVVFTVFANVLQTRFSKPIITQTKEIDLIQKSPLFDLFKKTLSGVTQIKIFNQKEWFKRNFFQLTNRNISSNLAFYYTQRSFGFNIDLIGVITSIVGIYIIIGLNSDDQGVFVQSLLTLLTFNDAQQWSLRQLINFDATMNCFNRMFQIEDLDPEAPHHQTIDETLKKIQWPQKGQINLKNVFMRYRKGTDLVLKNLEFQIKAGDKVGCVGRTGAGKSSILQVLFRMSEIEIMEGSQLEIDHQDIRKVGLQHLRSNIAIIPQVPFVFSGTIRRNLDPLENYSDQQLWDVLEETNLKRVVENMKDKLLTDMSDVSSVFSVGEKQLICLARTILSNKKIIVLDEATANIDMHTDEYIQQIVRQKFKDCTIITIAHRLNTIADYDKVMVIDGGKVAEFGAPLELLSSDLQTPKIDRDTILAQLVKQTGQDNAKIILKMAYEHYQGKKLL